MIIIGYFRINRLQILIIRNLIFVDIKITGKLEIGIDTDTGIALLIERDQLINWSLSINKAITVYTDKDWMSF